MASLKHVGRIRNTGRRCVVVFREIYDDRGNVVDENNCLVVETDTLPDAEHQDIIRIVESEPAQSTGDVFNVFARERLGSGVPALNWMAQTGRLRKFPTNNVVMLPDRNTEIGLDTLNKIVKMQKAGASKEDIQRFLQSDTALSMSTSEKISEETVVADANTSSQSGEIADVLDDTALAKNLLNQADIFEQQAKDLRTQAYEMDPSLQPKSKSKTSTRKEPANNKA